LLLRQTVLHVWTSDNRGPRRQAPIVPWSERERSAVRTWETAMARFVGLDVSQKLTSVCVVDKTGRRIWRGQCSTDPAQLERIVKGRAGEDARVGLETGPMTPWLVHALRDRGLDVVCLDARHASAALKMQMNKTDQNDAEGLAQIMRTGWFRPVHVKSLDAHRARALLGARAQLVGMTTRLSNQIRGILKTFGLLPGSMRDLPFDRRVEDLLSDRDDLAPIVRPMLVAWRQLRVQIAEFDRQVRALTKKDPTCRLLMSVPGIGVVSVLAYVSTVEDPARFARSRSVGAHLCKTACKSGSDAILVQLGVTFYAAPRSLARSKSSLARPYIWRLTNFNLVFWPSVCPFDHCNSNAAWTAA
jgi:transposase